VDSELRDRVLAALQAIAAHPWKEDRVLLGQPGDVILLLQPLRAECQPEALAMMIDRLAEKNFLVGAEIVDMKGIAATLLPCALSADLGFHLDLTEGEGASLWDALFSEPAPGSRALVTTRPKAHLPLSNFVDRSGEFAAEAVGRLTAGDLRIRWMGEAVLELPSCAQLLPAKESARRKPGTEVFR